MHRLEEKKSFVLGGVWPGKVLPCVSPAGKGGNSPPLPARRRQHAEKPSVDRPNLPAKNAGMEKIIYPRSPREVMAGWTYLPRFVDKIRLHLAGKLPADYQENFTKGFDGAWLKAAGVSAEDFINVVKSTISDGEVCDWVLQNVKKSDAEKAEHREKVLNYGKVGDDALKARLKMRKEQAGLGHRDDIQCFVDFIDADEKRI